MRNFKVQVIVLPKDELLDPQGQAVEKAMERKGLVGAKETKVGKVIEFKITSENRETLERNIAKIAKELFSNPLIEDFTFHIEEF